MRILLTNNTLHFRAGSELYIYDVAVELLKRGHEPVAFSTVLGDVADLLRAATIPVIDDLSRLGAQPDVIHGQHHFDTLIAALTFPRTPVLNFCHGWGPWEEQPLIFPNVVGYIAVDHVCRDRLVFEHGIPLENIHVILNFVDTNRFRPRTFLPAAPKRAIAFGNLFHNDESLAILRAACAEAGIELEVAGVGVGHSLEQPEIELCQYDLVFAKARAALEAMATGTPVILCGPRGLGPMVTPREWDHLRPLNFGVRSLTLPMDVANVRAQIQRYDPGAAATLSERVHNEAALTGAVDELLRTYEGVIQRFPSSGFDPAVGQTEAAQYLQSHALILKGRAHDVITVATAQEREAATAPAPANYALAEVRRALTLSENVRTKAENALAQTNGELALSEIARMRAERALAQTSCELAELRNSATWRVARSVLRNPVLRFLRPTVEWIGSRVRQNGLIGDTSRLQARAQEMMARHGFLGVPVETFEQAGREQMVALLNEGLTPESKVLEIGCGCLRVAYWLIRFLDPGCYFGIEPARRRIDYGLEYLFTPEEITLKQPHFDFNANFDSSVFGVKFDFFLARSIWTHGSKRHIEATLDSFVRDSASTGIFLASYLPAQSPEEDYQGDRWVGTSHESDVPGVIRHRLAWIVEQCQVRGLAIRELPGIDCDSQFWLRINRE